MSGTLIAGVITIFLAAVVLLHHNLEGRRVHVRQSEEFHLDRYWKLLDDFPYEALAYCLPRRNDKLPGDLNKTCLLYLRLCESQCELRRRGDVSDRTWHAWVERMAGWLIQWPVKPVWDDVRKSPRQFKNLLELERTYDPFKYDPCPHGKLWRWGHGLRRFHTD